MQLVAGLHVADSAVTGWVADVGGGVQARVVRPLPVLRPAPERLELDPAQWEAACRAALAGAAAAAPAGDWLGLTVTTPGAGVVLLDRAGSPLGNGMLVEHGRTASLTLPRLLAVRTEEPERWERVARILFLHDWLVALMTGVHATEASYACSGGMADVAHRSWASGLLQESGIRASQLAPIVRAGTVVGELLEGWGAPATLPVVAGCAQPQLSAMGAGGLSEGVVTVIAEEMSRVQLATGDPAAALRSDATVSTHAAHDLWSVELAGEDAESVPEQVEQLERILGRRADAVVVCGEEAGDGHLPARLATALGRHVHHAQHPVMTVGAAVLVARAVGAHAHLPRLPTTVVPPERQQGTAGR